MDPDRQPGSIASHVAKSLESFRNLELTLCITAGSNYLLEGARPNDFPLQIENDFTRFKMWVGDQVAHRSGLFSLDYRLREAGHLQKQVIYLLTDICESLHTATSLVNDDSPFLEKSQREGDDGISQDNDCRSSFTDSDDDDESDVCDEGPSSSLLTLSADIGEAIDCLLRLSVAIANPAPLERFQKTGPGPSEDISFYESRDIAYARDKFPTITDELARALGKFITRRRQFFKYRHHERLAPGEEPVISDKETETCHKELISETVTSSLPKRSKSVANPDTHVFANKEDIQADDRMWQMSYVALAGDWRLPPRPSAAELDLIECPFCCRTISAKTNAAWEQHIFGDLRPYICLFSECIESNLDFDRQESWQSHLLKYHWRSWSCPFKCQQPFSAAAELSRHIRQDHLPTGTKEDIKSIAALGERDAPNNASRSCPLCEYSIKGLAEYIDHVGRHLEQLALFALTSLKTEDFNKEAGNNEESNYELEVDADSLQAFSARSSPVLGTHSAPSFERLGKGKEPAFIGDAMSDRDSPDLIKPITGKKVAMHGPSTRHIKPRPPVATTDIPANEQEIKRKGKVPDDEQSSRFVAMSERRTALLRKSKSNQELPTAFFDHSLQADRQPSTDYPGGLMPAHPQSQIPYSMPGLDWSIPVHIPVHIPSRLDDTSGFSEVATLPPATDYSGYYMPQNHVVQAVQALQARAAGSTGEAPVSCVYPGCTARPFKRRADLERHIRYIHSAESNKDEYLCDYSGCTRFREPFHRRGHLRDHLHEYHGENISKGGAPSNMGSGATTWWRCPRCLARVYVSKHGYECPDCKKSKSVGKRRS